MIRRDAEDTIHALLRGFPIVTITGPRQSGKTTLAKAIFSDKPYASLEEPDVRLAAREDPRSFLARFPDGAVLDEVQRCPELLSVPSDRLAAIRPVVRHYPIFGGKNRLRGIAPFFVARAGASRPAPRRYGAPALHRRLPAAL